MKLYCVLVNDTLFNPGYFNLNYVVTRISKDLKNICKTMNDFLLPAFAKLVKFYTDYYFFSFVWCTDCT